MASKDTHKIKRLLKSVGINASVRIKKDINGEYEPAVITISRDDNKKVLGMMDDVAELGFYLTRHIARGGKVDFVNIYWGKPYPFFPDVKGGRISTINHS